MYDLFGVEVVCGGESQDLRDRRECFIDEEGCAGEFKDGYFEGLRVIVEL